MRIRFAFVLLALSFALSGFAERDPVIVPGITKGQALAVAKRLFREECQETWPCAMVADGPRDGHTYVWITIFPDEEALYEVDSPMARGCVVFNRAGRVVEKSYALCQPRVYI